MEKKLVWRGLLAGAIGGLLAFAFGRVFAEPQIQRAVDYEQAATTRSGSSTGPPASGVPDSGVTRSA
jgi:hypothetical protein